MKVTRTITYEGEPEYVRFQLEKSLEDGEHSLNKVKITVNTEGGFDAGIRLDPRHDDGDLPDIDPDAPRPIGFCRKCGADVFIDGGFCGVCEPHKL